MKIVTELTHCVSFRALDTNIDCEFCDQRATDQCNVIANEQYPKGFNYKYNTSHYLCKDCQEAINND